MSWECCGCDPEWSLHRPAHWGTVGMDLFQAVIVFVVIPLSIFLIYVLAQFLIG
jgi:hypothetical protein